MEREPAGWRSWMLGISGGLIVLLISLLLALFGRAYDHISDEHKEIFMRLLRIEQQLRSSE